MSSRTALITGSSGLIGSEAVAYLDTQGWAVHGVDNNMRRDFFGPDGDAPNEIPLVELETRWDYADEAHRNGIAEDCRIDATMHSIFGASKVAADVLVQEYGRYFDMPTVCFRGGCLTGPNHSGAELHG